MCSLASRPWSSRFGRCKHHRNGPYRHYEAENVTLPSISQLARTIYSCRHCLIGVSECYSITSACGNAYATLSFPSEPLKSLIDFPANTTTGGPRKPDHRLPALDCESALQSAYSSAFSSGLGQGSRAGVFDCTTCSFSG